MDFYFGTPQKIEKIADAVSHYDDKEFRSKTRSTVPMLDLLIHSRTVFDGIIDKIAFPTPYDLHLEYTVGPFGGGGKASHTDVMLTTGGDSLAIEAKWTERMYPAVRDWPKKGAVKTKNQNGVLNGWLARLGQTYSAAFDDVIYQMLHRAASRLRSPVVRHGSPTSPSSRRPTRRRPRPRRLFGN